jgi:hypothetical protein
VKATVHARNLADCNEGRESCDYSLLSAPEAKNVAGTERTRNYTACLTGRGYCDRARLTLAEAARIPRDLR